MHRDCFERGGLLPTPLALREKMPLSLRQAELVLHYQQQIKQIVAGSSPRLLLIIGPCSIHETAAALDFAARLKKLAAQVSDQFLIVMRCHVEKPRSANGWKGIAYDPDLDASYDILKGIKVSRSFLLEVAKMQVPIAAEFLDPSMALYYSDLVSFGVVGARTSASPIHRQFASGLKMAVGFKNPVDGDSDSALNALIVAKGEHRFIAPHIEGNLGVVHTPGNPFCPLILRGSKLSTNYDAAFIAKIAAKLKKQQLLEKVIVDCGHDNSKKDLAAQSSIFRAVVDQVLAGSSIGGIMMESFLSPGQQPLGTLEEMKYGISVTDPCLGWSESEALILAAAAALRNRSLSYHNEVAFSH